MFTNGLNLSEDEICGGGPDEGLGTAVVFLNIIMDGFFQFGHGAEGAPADSLVRYSGKPALHLVEP